jgi:CheY-like chemotaxis protein
MASKIMLVEDDTNLSDIYKARLEAEGFEIVSAKDGEEALAIAVKEHPDLVISDVMMPKISGFDMLDILRGTDGIKGTKVIMMTALGQSEDKERAEKLGADRYLVKSQVTLEDVVKTVHDVLGDNSTAAPSIATPISTTVATNPAQAPAPPATQTVTVLEPSNTDVKPVPVAVAPPSEEVESITDSAGARAQADAKPASDEQADALSQIQDFLDTQEGTSHPEANPAVSGAILYEPVTTPQAENPPTAPVTTVAQSETIITPVAPPPSSNMSDEDSSPAFDAANVPTIDGSVAIAHKKVIEPPTDITSKQDLSVLLAKEESTSPINTSTDGIFVNQSNRAGSVVSPTNIDNSELDPGNIAL